MKGLRKTKENFFGRIVKILRGGKKIKEEDLEEIEALLIASDMSYRTVERLIDEIGNSKDPISSLKTSLLEILNSKDTDLNEPDEPPFVISVVGVNGSGKTTTIGKLAHMFIKKGKKVVLAAADTFRAAAIEQLRIWADKVGADVVYQGMKADPGAVAYDAVNHALSKKKDVVIIDTAGRLHTKVDLMAELRKIHKVVKKLVPDAPHEVLLVMDATTGQNGLIQAEKFKESVGVTGIVLTKLDGTAKGGIVVTIVEELGIPIKFVGVGEKAEDLVKFDPEDFVNSILEDGGGMD